MREMEARSGEAGGLAFDTLYFGGGTPSLLSPEKLNALMIKMRSLYNLDRESEITLECNPEDCSRERIEAYRDCGINRIVLGVQTLNGRLRDRIGRRGPLCGRELLEEFFGVPGITHCLDLIIGLPGQSDRELEEDLQGVLRFRPRHISAYLLSVEEGTPLAGTLDRRSGALDRQREALAQTMERFTSAGYEHYEVSNYALPGYRSRHNLKYWKFLPYLGYGPSAHSFFRGERWGNLCSWEDYLADPAGCLVRDERSLSAAAVEYLFTSLRLREGMSLEEYRRVLGIPLDASVGERMERALARGFLERENRRGDTLYRLTDEGLFIMDAVIYGIVEPLL